MVPHFDQELGAHHIRDSTMQRLVHALLKSRLVSVEAAQDTCQHYSLLTPFNFITPNKTNTQVRSESEETILKAR
ncbi:hypothetical protein RJT34_04602 [Clitoria ternatea]|uniref:Uncharacterized protein n=1 Tax=Clitoria ternatea TaxID=43366 RepID=A0AAN9KMC5_CLITE